MAQTIITSPFTENRMTLAVSHSSHGFDANDIGKAVMSSGTDGRFQIARANSAANAEVVGVITAIGDVNNYTVTTSGVIDIAAAVPTATAGTVFFLAEAADSQLTSTEPTTVGAVSKPVAVITESNAKMLLIHYRGEVITNATASDTTYTTSWVDSSNDAILRLTAGGSGSGNDDLTMVAGSNITLTPSGDNLTIAAAAGANVKVGSFTRDSSASVGTQVVSGIGFTPKSVIFFTVQDGTHEMSVGMDDGTEARVVYHDHPTSANTFALADTSGSGMKSIRTIHASGGNTFNGKITALASGQFTVTWDKVGSPTGTITVMYMAFG